MFVTNSSTNNRNNGDNVNYVNIYGYADFVKN